MIRAIAFDLDDTLLDTTSILVPSASKQAFEILISNGLRLSLEECESHRLEMIKTVSHKDVLQHLAQNYGDEKTLQVLHEAIDAFYDPKIPAALPLLEGAHENILFLKNKYRLYIVTAGLEKAQLKKVKALGIFEHFEKIYVTNSLLKERKEGAFLDIIEREKIVPGELLCIGNSLSSEITDSLKIGAMACYFEFGEDRGSSAKLGNLKPQFHIRTHQELIPACKL